MMINQKINTIMAILILILIINTSIIFYVNVIIDQKENSQDIEKKDELEPIIYGPYIVEINRYYNNETEYQMILDAENTPPSEKDKWADLYGELKLASSVWNGSINYYRNIVENLELDHNYTNGDIKFAGMNYTASIYYQLGMNNTIVRTQVNLTSHIPHPC